MQPKKIFVARRWLH